MTLILHEHPFAAFCWKAKIALYERDVPFTPHLVDGDEGRAGLAELWPLASIPVLVDGDLTLPESTTIVEYLDGFGDAPPLTADRHARLWDRIIDGHVALPMQKIVADALRPEGRTDPEGVAQARANLEQAYDLLDGEVGSWSTFTIADCAAAPALFYARIVHRWDEQRLQALTSYYDALVARPSVARVIEEARPYRPNFPLPWPDWAD